MLETERTEKKWNGKIARGQYWGKSGEQRTLILTFAMN